MVKPVTLRWASDSRKLQSDVRTINQKINQFGTTTQNRFAQLERSGSRFNKALGAVGQTASGFLLAGGVQRGFAFFKRQFDESIEAASNLEQAVGGTRAVFTDASGTIDRFAANSAEKVGLSERAFREATISIGANLKRVTGDIDFAAEQSTHLVETGADLAATFGGDTKDAVDALGAAFRGEADPAERFGLNLKASAVNAEAAELGLGKVETGSEDYTLALLSLIDSQVEANGAVGQFGRESDTAAGQLQRLRAEQEDNKAELGNNLLPAYVQGITLTRNWTRLLSDQVGVMDKAGAGLRLLQGDFSGVRTVADDAATSTGAFQGEMASTHRTADDAAPAVDEAGDAIGEAGEEAETAAERIARLKGELDELKQSAIDATGAESDLEEAIDDAAEAADDNKATLDLNTEAGRENSAALRTLAERNITYRAKALEAGESTDTVRNKTERARKKFVEAAEQMGLTTKEAEALATEYGLIPANVSTEVTATNVDDTISRIDRVRAAVGNIGSTVSEIDARFKMDASGRIVPAHFARGAIRFAGQQQPTIASAPVRLFGEAGSEAFIPLASDSRRPRAIDLLRRTNELLGHPLVDPQITDRFRAGDIFTWPGIGRQGVAATRGPQLSSRMLVEATIKKLEALTAGAGVPAMMRFVRGAFPGLDLISGFRPGAITATGGISYHGRQGRSGPGRATDLPPRMDVFNFLARTHPHSTELIYSPAGLRQRWHGRPHWFSGITRAMHFDHIHWAMRHGGIVDRLRPRSFDRGGLLQPGATLAINRTGRAEHVTAETQLRKMIREELDITLQINGKTLANLTYDDFRGEIRRRGHRTFER